MMDFQTDLKRVLWHELRHLCADIIDVKSNSDFTIDSLLQMA